MTIVTGTRGLCGGEDVFCGVSINRALADLKILESIKKKVETFSYGVLLDLEVGYVVKCDVVVVFGGTEFDGQIFASYFHLP